MVDFYLSYHLIGYLKKKMSKPRGFFLGVGVNTYSKSIFPPGSVNDLKGCVNNIEINEITNNK